MGWDFSTEPEFQEQLDWMREFVLNEVEPLDRRRQCAPAAI